MHGSLAQLALLGLPSFTLLSADQLQNLSNKHTRICLQDFKLGWGERGRTITHKESMNHYSLIPRPHPFNDLVNQVKFLGLPHTFVTASPSNFQISTPNLLKNVRILKQRFKNLTVAKEVIIINLAISLLFGNKPKKFDFVHRTASYQEACVVWA